MWNSKSTIALYALVALLAIAPSTASAQSCGTEPSVSSAASFQSWRRWCSCRGGTPASDFNTAQRQGCPVKSGSSSSSSAVPSGGSIGTIIGTAIGQEIGKSLFGDPEADARRRVEEGVRAEEQRRALEEANRKQEEQKNRLLGGMMGVDGSPQLGLMGVESSPGLSLMTDSPSQARSSIFSKGFEHASQCISQNAGSSCAGVTAEQQQACVADYRAGYDSGSQQSSLVLQQAYQAGQRAGERGERANAAPDQRAEGPCWREWIESYNRGHFQGKNAVTR